MYWSHLKKTALLGTTKMPLQLEPLPEPIQKALAEEKNTEDLFLKASAMTLLYEKAGTMHEKVTFPNQAFSETETSEYSSKNIHAIWKGFLNEDKVNYYLVEYLLLQCTQNQLIVQDHLIVPILNKFFTKFKSKLYPVIGKKGLWLTQFNPDWQDKLIVDNVWTEGKPSARKLYFSKLRKETPNEALALLEASWSSETGKDLKDFLNEFFHRLSSQDLDFLNKVHEELAQIKKPKDITSDTIKIILRLKLGIYGCDWANSVAKHIVDLLPKYLDSEKKPVEIATFWEETKLRETLGMQPISPYRGVSDELYWISETLTYLHPQYIFDYFDNDIQKPIQKFVDTPESLLLNAFSQSMELATPDQIDMFLSSCDFSKYAWHDLIQFLNWERQEVLLMKNDSIDLAILKDFVLLNPHQEYSTKFSTYILSVLASVIVNPQTFYTLMYEHDLMSTLGRCFSTQLLKQLDNYPEQIQTEPHRNMWERSVVVPLKSSLYYKKMIQAEFLQKL
ncbi:DUF5691 domain-containing protein [Cellulophaga sp. BC115SP]|uniref:DUF5691 domain-containing protein n=1 Tax=Cellulophaga sp. BC115SP TaxID=2683263 RepID=UPI001411D908|nr:DUF5691 domain-containing protein [Cellulophaga sp. BC115SP]NBB29621.1 hypothetical protein [Cellulophaga sp. BC115SP]